MRRLALIFVLVLLAACVSQSDLELPSGPSAPEVDKEDLDEISQQIPDIESNVTVHETTDILPEASNPFPEIV